MDKTVAIDFDGVIHKFSKGWQDGTIYDPPNKGAFESINSLLKKGIAVFIHSTRDPVQIAEWMNAKQDLFDVAPITVGDLEDGIFFKNTGFVGVTQFKLPAKLYLDDRALVFTDWQDSLEHILMDIYEDN